MYIRRILSIAVIMLLAAAGQSGAITWGEPDGGEHPHVGTMIFVQNGMGYYSCSGTLISSRVMLTAGHCVEAAGNPNDVTYVRFDEDAVGDYFQPTSAWLAAKWLEVEAVMAHPMFDDFSGFPMTYDVGVVILKDPVYPDDGMGGYLYGELPEQGFLATLRGKAKKHFTAVGYGMQGNLRPTFQNDWERYKGKVKLIEIKSMLTAKGLASAKFSNNPGRGGGTCFGDSGGPIFFRNGSKVVAVVSFGWMKNGHCVGNEFQYRIDTDHTLAFLETVLAAYPDPSP
jgi:hypothetical protein